MDTDKNGCPAPAMSQPAAPDLPGKPSDTEVLGVWVFLAVLVFPAALAGLGDRLRDSIRPSYHETLTAVATAVATTAVVWFVAWKSGLPPARLGLTRPRWLADEALGLILAVVAWVLYRFAHRVVGETGLGTPFFSDGTTYGRPVGWLSWGAALMRAGVIGFSEELAFRGFLVPALVRVLDSRVWAVVVSAVAFGACHIYQGAAGTLGATLFGVLMAITLLTVGRLWPAVLAHAFMNFRNVAFATVPEWTGNDGPSAGAADW